MMMATMDPASFRIHAASASLPELAPSTMMMSTMGKHAPLLIRTGSASLPELMPSTMMMASIEPATLRIRTASPSFSEFMPLSSFEDSQGSISPGLAVHDNLNQFDHGLPLGETVQVYISGTSFLVEQATFQKLKKLPWRKEDGVFYLGTSADLFESVLNFLVFKTLPDPKTMSSHDKDELEVMSILLELPELAASVKKRSSFMGCRQTSSASSVGNSLKGKNVILRTSSQGMNRSSGERSESSENGEHSEGNDYPPTAAANKGGIWLKKMKKVFACRNNHQTEVVNNVDCERNNNSVPPLSTRVVSSPETLLHPINTAPNCLRRAPPAAASASCFFKSFSRAKKYNAAAQEVDESTCHGSSSSPTSGSCGSEEFPEIPPYSPAGKDVQQQPPPPTKGRIRCNLFIQTFSRTSNSKSEASKKNMDPDWYGGSSVLNNADSEEYKKKTPHSTSVDDTTNNQSPRSTRAARTDGLRGSLPNALSSWVVKPGATKKHAKKLSHQEFCDSFSDIVN